MKRIISRRTLIIFILSIFIIAMANQSLLFAQEGTDTQAKKEIDNFIKSMGGWIENGEYQKILNKSQEIIDKYPDSPYIPMIMSGMTHTYIEMNDLESAIRVEKKIIEKYEGTKFDDYAQSSKVIIVALKAVKSEKERKFNEAISAYNELKEISEGKEPVIEWIEDAISAIEYYQHGQKDKALEIYKCYLNDIDTIIQNWAQRGISRCTKSE